MRNFELNKELQIACLGKKFAEMKALARELLIMLKEANLQFTGCDNLIKKAEKMLEEKK
jgi:hypothetical protein